MSKYICDPWRNLTRSEIETVALRLPAEERYISAIAREMNLRPVNVRYFIDTFGLREKVGICDGRCKKTGNGETKRVRKRRPAPSIGAKGKKYIIAMRALKNAQECVTPCLIVRRTQASLTAVLLWLRSHRDVEREYGVISNREYNTLLQTRRYARLVESGEISSMTVMEIAAACQCNNKKLSLIISLYHKQKSS